MMPDLSEQKNRVHIEPAGLGAEERQTSAEGSGACERWPGGLCPRCGYRACMLVSPAQQARRDVRDALAKAAKAFDRFAFAVAIRSRMEERAVNQLQVATEAGVQPSALCRVLGASPHNPSVETYLRLMMWLAFTPAHASRSDVTASEGEVSPGTNS